MKIIHICLNCSYFDNMEYQENVLPRKHLAAGNEVRIITSRYGRNEKGILSRKTGMYLNEDSIPVAVLGYKYNGRFKRAVGLYWGLREQLDYEKPDVLFVHGILFSSFQEVIDYKFANPHVKIFADSHIDYINCPIDGIKHKLQFAFWRKKIIKWIPNIEKIWGVTPQRVDFLKKELNIPSEKTGYLPMGGDEQYIHLEKRPLIRRKVLKEYEINENSFVIATGGKIDKKKNIHLLLNAIEKIYYDKGIKNIVLIIFGKVEEEAKSLIDGYYSKPFVKMIGWKSPRDIYNVLTASDLCVFPGTHSVLWEQSVACGRPCVFKHWENMHHVDLGGNCVFLYLDDVNEIQNSIYDIITENEKYFKMESISLDKGHNAFLYNEIAKKAIHQKLLMREE